MSSSCIFRSWLDPIGSVAIARSFANLAASAISALSASAAALRLATSFSLAAFSAATSAARASLSATIRARSASFFSASFLSASFFLALSSSSAAVIFGFGGGGVILVSHGQTGGGGGVPSSLAARSGEPGERTRCELGERGGDLGEWRTGERSVFGGDRCAFGPHEGGIEALMNFDRRAAAAFASLRDCRVDTGAELWPLRTLSVVFGFVLRRDGEGGDEAVSEVPGDAGSTAPGILERAQAVATCSRDRPHAACPQICQRSVAGRARACAASIRERRSTEMQT